MSLMFEMMIRDRRAKEKLREKFPGVPLNDLDITVSEKEQLLQLPYDKLNEDQKEALKKLELNYELAQTIGRRLDRMYSIEDATFYCENKEIFKASYVKRGKSYCSAENLVNELDMNSYQPLDTKEFGNKTIIVCRRKICNKRNKHEADISYQIEYLPFYPDNPEVFTSVVKRVIEKLPPYAQRLSRIPPSCSDGGFETLKGKEYEAFDKLYNSKLLKLSCEVVNSFYSKSMRDHFFEHPKEFTIGQLSTLAFRYMEVEKVPQFFRTLSEVSKNPEEKAYLESVADEWINADWSKIYDLLVVTDDQMDRAIFRAKCQLPVLAKRGDPVIFKDAGELHYGVVFSIPDYNNHKALRIYEECYGIYSLEGKSPGLVYPWHLPATYWAYLPNVEVIPTYALPKKEKEHFYSFVRDIALIDLLTAEDRASLRAEYENNGNKQIPIKELIEKRQKEEK